MAFLMIFWDGVGLGKEDSHTNPFFAASLPNFRGLLDGALPSLRRSRIHSAVASVVPVNATLGVPGLPQSGTGQTAIFTGVNAPRKIGKHFGPHPYSTLVPIVKEQNLFVRLRDRGKSFYFANAYPQRYFDYISSPRGKIPVVAMSYLAAGGELNTLKELENGEGLSADITGEGLKSFNSAIRPMLPQEAGERFYRLGRPRDLILFEYFLTDKAGHDQSMSRAVDALERIDGFLGGILRLIDPRKDTILFVSDHGNIEDLTTRSHTRNPVPMIVFGEGRDFFCSRVRRLTDITPAVTGFLAG